PTTCCSESCPTAVPQPPRPSGPFLLRPFRIGCTRCCIARRDRRGTRDARRGTPAALARRFLPPARIWLSRGGQPSDRRSAPAQENTRRHDTLPPRPPLAPTPIPRSRVAG